MNDINKNVLYWTSTLNNIGSLEGTLQYYHHVTPGEPCWRVLFKEPILFREEILDINLTH